MLRHWQRGPHLRLVVEDDETVPDLLARHVLPYLRDNPSRTVLDEAALLPRHRRQAAAEQVTGPLAPFHANNTVVRTREEDRTEVLGSPRAQEFFRAFYVRSTPLLLRALEEIRAGRLDRLEAFGSLVLTTVHRGTPAGLGEGYVSLRSHAEAFLAEADSRGELRARWTRLGEERAAALAAEVERARDGRERIAGWLDLLAWARDRARALVEDDAVAFRSLRDQQEPDAVARTERRVAGSSFHRALATDDEWFRTVESSTGFRTHRVCLNLAYHAVSQLGGTPLERYFLCHVLADAVERGHRDPSSTRVRTAQEAHR